MTYKVQLWTPDPHVRGDLLAETRHVGSRKAGRLCAESLLKAHAVETTWALRGHVRAAYAIVLDPTGAAIDCYDAPVTFVDSIGDRLRRGETVVV